MRLLLLPALLTCGPAVLSTFSLVRTLRDYRSDRVRLVAPCAVGVVWLITAYAACVFLCYGVKPSTLPPWEDVETLDLSLLSLLAPIGLISTVIAALGGVSRWAIASLVAGLLVLFIVGLLEAASV